jgi:hypothetical protein
MALWTAPWRVLASWTATVKATCEGIMDGSEDACDGIVDGDWEGILDGSLEGILDGTCEGFLEGLDGDCNGIMDGPLEGAYDGIVDGDCEGDGEGIMDGSFECHCFWAFGKKSDFLLSPKNESSHSSDTVISTSLT